MWIRIPLSDEQGRLQLGHLKQFPVVDIRPSRNPQWIEGEDLLERGTQLFSLSGYPFHLIKNC